MLGEYVRPAGLPVWTAALVRSLALLGVAEKAARQALARTAAEGWIASTRRGRVAQWELTAAGLLLLTDGARRIYSFGQDAAPWHGRWLVLLAGLPEAGLRHQLRTRLSWAGFGALPGGVWISPDPGREAEAARILDELGLAGTAMSFVAGQGGIGARHDLVARAWDLRAVQTNGLIRHSRHRPPRRRAADGRRARARVAQFPSSIRPPRVTCCGRWLAPGRRVVRDWPAWREAAPSGTGCGRSRRGPDG